MKTNTFIEVRSVWKSKPRFIKELEASRLLGNLKKKIPLSEIRWNFFERYKNEGNNKQVIFGCIYVYDWNIFKTAWIYI